MFTLLKYSSNTVPQRVDYVVKFRLLLSLRQCDSVGPHIQQQGDTSDRYGGQNESPHLELERLEEQTDRYVIWVRLEYGDTCQLDVERHGIEVNVLFSLLFARQRRHDHVNILRAL